MAYASGIFFSPFLHTFVWCMNEIFCTLEEKENSVITKEERVREGERKRKGEKQ